MARLTNMITVQASLWPVLAVFLAIAGQIWKDFQYHRLLAWGSVLVVQLIVVLWFQWQREIFRVVRYIEQDIRPEIAQFVKGRPFWNYERYLASCRGRGLIWWEWSLLLVCLLAIGLASWWQHPWHPRSQPRDFIGLLVNAAALIVAYLAAFDAIRIRLGIFPPS